MTSLLILLCTVISNISPVVSAGLSKGGSVVLGECDKMGIMVAVYTPSVGVNASLT